MVKLPGAAILSFEFVRHFEVEPPLPPPLAPTEDRWRSWLDGGNEEGSEGGGVLHPELTGEMLTPELEIEMNNS